MDHFPDVPASVVCDGLEGNLDRVSHVRMLISSKKDENIHNNEIGAARFAPTGWLAELDAGFGSTGFC
ncbi:MAG TPA: hypothetical protein VMS37_24845 [Verrucomicrobiae bacterium]|nr:hypothetical protein [Verrucomicrobiae bacterium]